MFGSKYSNVLTILLVVVIVGIIGIVGYFGYDLYIQSTTNNNAQTAISEFDKAVSQTKKSTNQNNNATEEEISNSNPIQLLDTGEYNSEVAQPAQQVQKTYMEGYEVLGKIKIPKTNIEYPILAEFTKRALEIAIGVQWPVNLEKLNEPGNTVLLGHNYRNGVFFSNNKKLAKGDSIIITDATGETVTYIIYNIYETSPNDVSHIQRDTDGAREISLQTCTDDAADRLMIWARER